MQTVSLSNLIQLQRQPINDAVFVIASGKSTFIQVAESDEFSPQENFFYASPTPLCGDSAHQYNPCFVMAVLSVTPMVGRSRRGRREAGSASQPYLTELLDQIQLPKVLFDTDPNIRRSMTLNAMRMSTELFALGSERVFQLAQQRLEADQPDVVHDLLVYLMHAILDARRDYAQETALRAESLAAYLGIEPTKVLLLMREYGDDELALTNSLEQGQAGILQRKLNVAALVNNQMELLTPYRQSAQRKETQVIEIIRRVLDSWKLC
jgi:hypothetical protein